MATKTDERLKSGDMCTESGRYVFDGYVSDVTAPEPVGEERETSLEIGQPFPAVTGASRNCYWKLVADLPGGSRSEVTKWPSPHTADKVVQREGA